MERVTDFETQDLAFEPGKAYFVHGDKTYYLGRYRGYQFGPAGVCYLVFDSCSRVGGRLDRIYAGYQPVESEYMGAGVKIRESTIIDFVVYAGVLPRPDGDK